MYLLTVKQKIFLGTCIFLQTNMHFSTSEQTIFWRRYIFLKKNILKNETQCEDIIQEHLHSYEEQTIFFTNQILLKEKHLPEFILIFKH